MFRSESISNAGWNEAFVNSPDHESTSSPTTLRGRQVILRDDGKLQVVAGHLLPASVVNAQSRVSIISDNESVKTRLCDIERSLATIAKEDTLVEVYEKEYESRRDEIVDEQGNISTPLKVVKDIAAEFNLDMEIHDIECHIPQEKYGPGRIIHQVRVAVKDFEGVGEAPRYRLAIQLAAADILEKVKRFNGSCLQPYGLLPGSRLNSWIYRDLRELCAMEGLLRPSFERVSRRLVPNPKRFVYKCSIGQLDRFGTSDSLFMAKRLSAKDMFEALTGEDYPKDRVATGKGCLQKDDFEKMGIRPIASSRSSRRGKTVLPSPMHSTEVASPRSENFFSPPHSERSVTSEDFVLGQAQVTEDEIYEDEFAEAEDDISITGREFNRINLNLN